jgi:hypothetical protein
LHPLQHDAGLLVQQHVAARLQRWQHTGPHALRSSSAQQLQMRLPSLPSLERSGADIGGESVCTLTPVAWSQRHAGYMLAALPAVGTGSSQAGGFRCLRPLC